MTELYFAAPNSFHIQRDTFGRWDWLNPLNVLVAYEPKEGFLSWVQRGAGWTQTPGKFDATRGQGYQFAHYPDPTCTPGVKTILDSGAFSAWKSGTPVNLQMLIEEAKKRCPRWDEVVSLDVIGDPVESTFNAVQMQKAGLHVIPVFHYGEDWGYLEAYKDRFGGRVGLGGIATGISSTQKRKWLSQCFARAYPAKFHGFGVATKELLMKFPFYSVDTASWHTALRYGRSSAAPEIKQPKKSSLDGTQFDGSGYDLRYEIMAYLEMAQEVNERWKGELSWAH